MFLLSTANMLRRTIKSCGNFVMNDLAASLHPHSMKPRPLVCHYPLLSCPRLSFVHMSKPVLSRRFVSHRKPQRLLYPLGVKSFSTSSTLELEENTKSTGDSVPFARRSSSFQVRWSDEEFELYKILKSKKYPALHKKFEHYRKTNVATAVMYQFMIVSLKSMHGIRKKEVLLKLDNLLNEMETLGLPKDIEAYNSIFQVLQRYRLPNMIEKYLVDMDKKMIFRKIRRRTIYL